MDGPLSNSKLLQVILDTLNPGQMPKPHGSRQWKLPCVNRLLKRPIALELTFGIIFETCL